MGIAKGASEIVGIRHGATEIVKVYKGAATVFEGAEPPPNLVTNGTFDSDTSGWTAFNAGLSVVGGRLRVTNTAASGGQARQEVAVEVGLDYEVSVDLFPGDIGSSRFRAGTSAQGSQYGALTASGTIAFTATTTTCHLTCLNNSSVVDKYAEYDNIRMIET